MKIQESQKYLNSDNLEIFFLQNIYSDNLSRKKVVRQNSVFLKEQYKGRRIQKRLILFGLITLPHTVLLRIKVENIDFIDNRRTFQFFIS
jgi:hypothetical protein